MNGNIARRFAKRSFAPLFVILSLVVQLMMPIYAITPVAFAKEVSIHIDQINDNEPSKTCFIGEINLDGSGILDHAPGNVKKGQYHVKIDWGDGYIQKGIDISTTEISTDVYTYSFTATHIPLAPIATITAFLYHVKDSGEDGDAENYHAVDVCVTPPVQPKLTVTKEIINDNGGNKTVQDFPLFVGTTPVTSGEQNGFNAGTYTVRETQQTGYEAVISGDCASDGSITLSVGDVKSCTITNNDIQPKLTVVKKVAGGPKQPWDFTIEVTGVTVSNSSFPGADDPGTTITLNVGDYSVTEDVVDKYTPSFSSDCSGTIAIGDAKTCVITNTYIEDASLTVVKHVVNDNGGNAIAEDFTIHVQDDGVDAVGPQPGSESGTIYALEPGTYTISENTNSGYTESISEGCNGPITLSAGESKTCTITNDDIAPKLHLRKIVDNSKGGTAGIDSFLLIADGNGYNDLMGFSPVDSGLSLKADTFVLSEEPSVANYTASDWVCDGGTQNGSSVTLGVGEEATCTITNSYIEEPEQPFINVVASKIVCDNESLLPNWGASEREISATTAEEYVESHPGCRLVPDWSFEWGNQAVNNPGDAFVGQAGDGWTTFGPTNASGTVETTIDISDVTIVKLREVLKEGYIPFAGPTNDNNVSAEFYCGTDVEFYDNFDFIESPEAGATYHCVAFNARRAAISGYKYNDLNNNGLADQGEGKLSGWEIQLIKCPYPPLSTDSSTYFLPKGSIGGEMPGSCTVSKTTTTGEDGSYSFTDLEAGDYGVSEVLQTGWTQTFPADNTFYYFNLATSESATNIDFLNHQSTTPPPSNQCSDGADNDGDTLIDMSDPGCHTDGNASNTSSYDPNDNNETNVIPPQCSDGVDNDDDGSTDMADPTCHSDGNPSNEGSYAPEKNSEQNTLPVITLGSASITVYVGSSFNAKDHATANDAEDGVITANITFTSNVNTGSAGAYEVKYDVKDSEGAVALQKTLAVNVISQGCVSNCGGGGGGGMIVKPTIIITNENVSNLGGGKAKVTWTTNIETTEQVVYGDNSVVALGTAPSYGYDFVTSESDYMVKDHSVIVSGLVDGTTYYFRPVADRLGSTGEAVGKEVFYMIYVVDEGQVKGATTIPVAPCNYLLEYIKLGANNNPEEVRKLEVFLNQFEGENLIVNGIYEKADFDAVSRFQEKYMADILSPWKHNEATGYVYITTKKQINELYCQREFVLTPQQLAEIASFVSRLSGTGNAGISGTESPASATEPESGTSTDNSQENTPASGDTEDLSGVVKGASKEILENGNDGQTQSQEQAGSQSMFGAAIGSLYSALAGNILLSLILASLLLTIIYYFIKKQKGEEGSK